MSEKDGGPAFPHEVHTSVELRGGMDGTERKTYGGMSLRDYFAGQALSGGMLEFLQGGDTWSNYDDFAKSVYAMADAMLKERAK